jgi:hypothetical protein
VWQGLLEFTIEVVGQIAADVVRLFNLGFTNIAVTQLPPLGCEPVNTRSGNYTACVTLENLSVTFHNSLLVSNPSITLHPANIIFLDFYNAFNSIFNASPGTTGKTPNIIFTLNVFLLSSNPKRKKLKFVYTIVCEFEIYLIIFMQFHSLSQIKIVAANSL